ncbi:MAG: amidohydrolase family protein [Desulfobacterales bacterium]
MTANSVLHIAAGWVLDGTGGPVRNMQMVRIQGRSIAAVRDLQPDDLRVPGLVDLTGATLLPGLVDSHVHLFMSGTTDPGIRKAQLEAEYQDIEPAIQEHLRSHDRGGVCMVRDGGDYGGFALRYRHENECTGLTVKTAGKAWRRSGRYGKLIGRPPRPGRSLADAIAACADPLDHVKVANSGLNSLNGFGLHTQPQFSTVELASAVASAARRGWGIMAHANGEAPVRLAVEAGCRSVEHGYFMGRKNLERMAERGTFWVPTLMPMKAIGAVVDPKSGAADISRRNLDHQMDQVAYARRIGVRIALGTDAGAIGVHHGQSVREEMRLLIEAGLTIPEAVHAATRAGAELAGEEGLGMIRPGFSARIIAVDGPPEGLPESLGRICWRVVEG